MNEINIDEIVRKHGLHRYPNVVGWSSSLKPRIRKGKIVREELCIRIYVSKKVGEKELAEKDVLPRKVEDIAVDVVEIGEVKALNGEIDKTGFFRPFLFGVSIGNRAISAGTAGWMFKDKKGNIYAGSNAHVLADDPFNPPEKIREKRIVQPGNYDLTRRGLDPDDPKYLVGYYFWHKQIFGMLRESNCPVAKFIAGTYNLFAGLLGCKTRLTPVVEDEKYNYVDFAVFEPTVDYILGFPDFNSEKHVFYGLLFAGSDSVTVVCKASKIAELGYIPLDREWAEKYNVGDIICKSGRTSCFNEGKVVDESAAVKVWYNNKVAFFKDVVLTTPISKPGDSGSSVWKKP